MTILKSIDLKSQHNINYANKFAIAHKHNLMDNILYFKNVNSKYFQELSLYQYSKKRKNYYSMFQAFLTAPDLNEQGIRISMENNSNNKVDKLKEMIKAIISSMPCRETCQQTAINIGLPKEIIDFQKILKLTNTQTNISSLNFTYNQLKTLQKQALKLKKDVELPQCLSNQRAKVNFSSQKRKQTTQLNCSEKKNIQIDSQQEIKKTIQQELEFRTKIKKFYSTDKMEKKSEHIKKKAQKAKSMNKRVYKIYKGFKDKQTMQNQFFKIETIYSASQKKILKEGKSSNNEPLEIEQVDEKDHLCEKLSILRSQNTEDTSLCKPKTAGSRFKEKEIIFKTKNEQDSRFIELKRRQIQTRQRKLRMESQREDEVITKLIKKQEKLLSIKTPQNRQQKVEESDKFHYESMIKEQNQLHIMDLQKQIKANCQQKQARKEMQLRERVNRIREQLKLKQQRRKIYRLKRQKQLEEMNLDTNAQEIHLQREKQREENDLRHERIIRQRYEQIKQKQNLMKKVNRVAHLTDEQLQKSLIKINNKNIASTLFFFSIF